MKVIIENLSKVQLGKYEVKSESLSILLLTGCGILKNGKMFYLL